MTKTHVPQFSETNFFRCPHITNTPDQIFFLCNPIRRSRCYVIYAVYLYLRYFFLLHFHFFSLPYFHLVRERKLIINGTFFFNFLKSIVFSLPLVIDLLLMTVCPFKRGWQTISSFFFPFRLRRTRLNFFSLVYLAPTLYLSLFNISTKY